MRSVQLLSVNYRGVGVALLRLGVVSERASLGRLCSSGWSGGISGRGVAAGLRK